MNRRSIGMQKFLKIFPISAVIKLFLAINFIFFIILCLYVNTYQTIGYESSIYSNVPHFFWPVLLSNVSIGIFAICYTSYCKNKDNMDFVAGLLLVLFCYILIISLPIIKDYELYGRHDVLTHVGNTINLMSSGYFNHPNIIYPGMYIILSSIYYITDLDLFMLFKLMPVCLSIIFFIFLFILYRFILTDFYLAAISTLAGSVLLSISTVPQLTPNTLGNLVIPLALYLYVRSIYNSALSVNFRVCLTVFIFLLPILHPVSTILFSISILSMHFVIYYLSKYKLIEKSSPYYISRIVLPMLIWGISWWSETLSWNAAIRGIADSFTESTDNTAATILLDKISYASQNGYSVINQFIRIYGDFLIYMILTIISFYLLLRKLRMQKSHEQRLPNCSSLFPFYGAIISCSFLMIALFGTNISFSPFRVLAIMMLISPIFLAVVFFSFSPYFGSFFKRKYIATILLIIFSLLLIICSLNGFLKMYPSSYILTPNSQVTRSEIDGMDWFFSDKNISTTLLSISLPGGRFEDLLLRQNEINKRKFLTRVGDEKNQLAPYHFNYNVHDKLGYSVKNNTYLVLSKSDRIIYREIFPEIENNRYTKDDFHKLESDSSIDKLYSNEGLDIRLIYSKM